ncbi:MAG: hypothetical protein J4F28_09575 [Nitrosopumilaceae archaeon]|nr:hypothetical protein [Nitrosopumilaceae archaeon]
MPIILQRGEMMESQHKVSTMFGGGMLHVTNRALIIEIKKKGIIFHRFHNQMSGIKAKGLRKIRLQWPKNSDLFDFEFKAWGAGNIVRAIAERHDYARNYSLDGVTRAIFTEQQRNERWAAKQMRNAEKRNDGQATEMWRWFLLYAHGISCSRSVRIPGRVEDHVCWNDSWLDDRYAYTFNHYWVSGRFEKAPVRGGGTDPETGAYRIPVEHVRFFHGYPYVSGDAFADPVYEQGFLIPTMLESMTDGEMIARRYRPRDRLEMGVGLDVVDPTSILGYLNDPKEATIGGRNDSPLTPAEARVLHGYGLVPDEVIQQIGR